MLRLERVVIQGFKSFVEKTDIRFLPGITCIVGPNGCGKSNVADAVRWAIGEQSPKSLRGHRMEDVIFHGSASRKPVGLAEVTLDFSNDGSLDVPWSEVALARRLYRTGDSEYVLNKSVCRLRDIQDLFAGTGVSPRAYALMDQERLNHVLTAKPWERRAFIEEAAGIARYKQQRTETEGKLDGTRQNLQHVRAVMDEVRRQLASLERQARKAQQYKALHQERQALALALLAADFAALSEQQRAQGDELGQLRARHAALDAQVAVLDARVAAQRGAIQEAEYRLGDLRQSAQKLQGEVERLIERREQLGVQRRELAEEDGRLAEELGQIAERQAGLAREARDKAAAREQARSDLAAREEQLAGLESALAASQEEVEARRQRAEALRIALVAAVGRRTDLAREEAELRERRAQLDRRAERLEDERAAARAERERLAVARHRLEERRRLAGAQLSLLEGERSEVRARLEEREGRRAALQTWLEERRLMLAARRSSLEALEKLEREREGYGAGVRAVFAAQARGGLPGLVGTVADLLEVPADLEAAVEGVLGDRLQWVVVERFADARAALGYLAGEGRGAATFLPLETLGEEGSLPEDSSEVQWVVRHVGATRPALVPHLLGRVGIVDHLDRAEALWRRNGVVATYVTPAGEVLSPTGRLTGGRRGNGQEDNDHSILRRKRAIRQMGEEVAALEAEVDDGRRRLEALEAEVTALRALEATLQSSVQSQAAARLTEEKDLEAAQREEERVGRHLETISAEHGVLETERGEAAGRFELAVASLAEAGRAAEGLEGELERLRGDLDGMQEEERWRAGELSACRVERAAGIERLEALGRDLERVDQLQQEGAARFEHVTRRRQQMAARHDEVGDERERADAQARAAADERDRAEAAVRAQVEGLQGVQEGLEIVEVELRALLQERQRVVGRGHEIDIALAEGRVRLEELLQEAARAHGVDGGGALLAAHDPARDLGEARGRAGELAGRLEAMGAVNLVADEEYRELDERLSFLRTQHEDLVGSIKDLDKALRGMTRTAQERFQEAFEAINQRFGDIFSRLFEGGRAELRMVTPEEGDADPLEQGVELMAQPRGKRLQAVTLMSGGEKALTGLALLFAIFYYRPSPFCVLDEVDAPLDDANIHRFLRVLRELVAHTQFIVITHNRKTMEAADVLYGVTMEEPGLSRVVSVRMAEA